MSLDLDPETGGADSGDLEKDLTDLFIAVAEAAEDHHRSVAILIDEIQYFGSKELSALIAAMHRMQHANYLWYSSARVYRPF